MKRYILACAVAVFALSTVPANAAEPRLPVVMPLQTYLKNDKLQNYVFRGFNGDLVQCVVDELSYLRQMKKTSKFKITVTENWVAFHDGAKPQTGFPNSRYKICGQTGFVQWDKSDDYRYEYTYDEVNESVD